MVFVPPDPAPGGGGPPPGPQVATLSGDINVFIPQQQTVVEAEPNNTQLQAHFLGDMLPGRTVTIVGHVRAGAGGDVVDAYRILASQRVRIRITLDWEGTGDPDFAVGLWDFTSQQYVEFFFDPASPITGEIWVKGVFALVVSVLQGDGDYVMKLETDAAATRIPERAGENEFFYSGQFLGEVVDGDQVTMEGKGHPTIDVWDSATIVCPEAVSLELICHIPDTGFPQEGECDIVVYDITGGEDEPPIVDAFIWGAAGVDAAKGRIEVPAGTLLQVFVFSFSGDATYNLTLLGDPPRIAMNALNAAYAALGPRAPALAPAPFIVGQAVVRPAEEGDPAFATLLADLGCIVSQAVPNGSCCVSFDVPNHEPERHTARMIASLARSPCVRYAEPNYVIDKFVEPDDPAYLLQWHYPLMRLDLAWDISTGSNSVIVAVVDTGMTLHPDLEGRQIPGYDFIVAIDSARDGDGPDPDPTDEGNSPSPGQLRSRFHGTHVAGTIAAVTNNGDGVAGATWRTRVMHVRVLGALRGTILSVVNGILYAAGLPNSSGTVPAEAADIINMSLGLPVFSQALQDACTDARNAGLLLFAASGNDGNTVRNYPAANADVNAVGAVDISKGRAIYSSYGDWLDFVAPGGDKRFDVNVDGYVDGVLSTSFNDLVSPAEPIYSFEHGTSMACPHAAAVAALILAVDPSLTPAQVETIMKSTAEDLGSGGFDIEFGFGLIDALAALREAQGAGDPMVPPVLSFDAVTLSFQPQEMTRRIAVTNAGGQTLLVGPLTAFTKAGENWLSATTVPGTVAASDTSAIEITVDRAGLADGVYFGRMQVESNGGTRQIQVLLNVQTAPVGPPDVEIFVRVVDINTGVVAREASVNPSTTLAFTLANVPPGTYRIVAGSDLNRNGILGEPGELFGIYPHSDSPILVEVLAGDDRGPFKFTVSPSGVLADG